MNGHESALAKVLYRWLFSVLANDARGRVYCTM